MSAVLCCPNGHDLRTDPIPLHYFDYGRHYDPAHAREMKELGQCFCLPYGDIPVDERFFSRVERLKPADHINAFRCPECRVEWSE